MATKTSGAGAGTDALEAAQRGFAAFGAAQELAMKAWMRAATRQAELARETLTDCMSVAAGMQMPMSMGAAKGEDQVHRAKLAAETWFRTWRSITDDLNHDLMEAADIMMASAAVPPSVLATFSGAARKQDAAR
jgi:hypothetical protein